MAKNYSIAEAVQIIAGNEDIASITDIGKRYPLLANIIARVSVAAGEDFVTFASFLPEHVSANKVNKAIKDFYDGADDADDEDTEAEEADDDEEEAEEEPKKPAKKAGRPKKAAKAEEEDESDEESDSDYDNMSNKELWALLGEVGGRKKCREEFGDTKTADMVKYFKKYYPNGVDAEQPEEEVEEVATDEYAGKSAVELYKICKTRKIKAEQKKPAKYYADLLKKADAEAAKAKKAEPEEDEWDEDEEEEAPAPKKGKAKAEKKPAKKAKEEEPEEDDGDDDDDWEI